MKVDLLEQYIGMPPIRSEILSQNKNYDNKWFVAGII